jgi:raffinose/stachyose/melibiose transport system permease protein
VVTSRRTEALVGFALPALVLYAVLVLYPLGHAVYLSLTDSTGGAATHYVGLRQFRALPSDVRVGAALRHTIVYAAVVVALQNLIGVALAAALFRRPRVRELLGTALLLPAVVPPLMAAFIWQCLYADHGGLNRGLHDAGLSVLAQGWLDRSTGALLSVAMVNVWMFAGYSCVLFLLGYAAIPAEVLDAAAADGAAGWRRFRLVEWPLLAPALTVSTVLSLIVALRAFELPLVLVGSHAGATETLPVLVFQKVLGDGSSQIAYGTAIALLLLLVMAALTGTVRALLRLRQDAVVAVL